MSDSSESSKKMFGMPQMVMAVLALLVLIAAGVGVYYYNQYKSLNNILKNPNVAVEKQTKDLVAQVGKLMMLPGDEQPTVATVTDASKLKDQAFFKNAKNGDKVLIYVKARKAILYRPSTNVIIDVAPVNISQNQQTTAPAPTGEVSVTPSKSVTPTVTTTVTPSPTK